MKKTFSFVATLLSSVAFLFGQSCTPDNSFTAVGIYPDTIQNLDTAYAGIYYEMVLQIVAPEDTVVDFGSGPQTVPINWIRVDGFDGLPAGFDYVCSTSDCVFPGGTNGCAVLYGTASNSIAGQDFPLVGHTTSEVDMGFLGLQEVPSTVNGYLLPVSPVLSTENLFNNSSVEVIHKGNTLEVNISSSEGIEVRLMDLTGKILSRFMSNNEKNLTVNLSNQATGIYIYQIVYGDDLISGKILIR
jgi:hypothetical protein